MGNNTCYNLEVVEKNNYWKFQIDDSNSKLIKSNNEPREIVKNFCEKILELDINSYDIVEYKGLIAFKFAPMRKTYIFTKEYYEGRCYNSPNLLNMRKIKLK